MAFVCFFCYGFCNIVMDDIVRVVGVSRLFVY